MNPTVASLLIDVLGLLSMILNLLVFVVIASAVVSWLVVFGVINTRNRGVYQVTHFLDEVSGRLLYPIRKFVPPIAGLDISPFIFWFICLMVRKYLIGSLIIQLSALSLGAS